MIIVDKQSRLTHHITVGDKSHVEIERICTWCHEQFGMRFSIVDRKTFGRDGVWQCIWLGLDNGGRYLDSSTRPTAGYKFSFDHEQDAVLFALRWS